MIRLSMMVVMTLSAAVLPTAAYAGQTAGTQNAKQQPDPGEVVCKDIDVSGLRFGTKRVCATRAEWQARQQGDREAVEQMQRPIQVCNIMGTRKC
jgi:hypothetical protein